MLTPQYCNAPVCAPSRASLMLGVHQGHANVRDNQFDKALEDNHTLGNVLQQLGYATVAGGKWGLQGTKNGTGQPSGLPAGNESLRDAWPRSEEHTTELQSLMSSSIAVLYLNTRRVCVLLRKNIQG